MTVNGNKVATLRLPGKKCRNRKKVATMKAAKKKMQKQGLPRSGARSRALIPS